MIPEYSKRPIGRFSTDFTYGVAATILQLVSIAANRIVKERLVDAKWEENKITNQLRQKVIEEKNLLNEERGGEIEGEVGTFHTIEGRIDIKVIYDWDEKNYFGIECNRLSGKNKGLDKKYVTDGLMRFITGKYSQGHQFGFTRGMMLGYVINGTCERAIQLVQERIDEHRVCLRIEKEFTRETRFNDYPTLHSSRHRQKITTTIIMILHYFFEIPQTSDS